MDKKRSEKPTEADQTTEELSHDHSGFEHYCNHFDDENDTFLSMVLEEEFPDS